MFITEKFKDIEYLVNMPRDYDEEKKYPALILMHGAGTRGEGIEKVKSNPFFIDAKPYIQDCLTFAPHCKDDTWFDIFEQVLDFCTFVSKCKNVDKNRVYLIGASMGAYAVWQMAMSKPELFAGIVPICGGGMYWNTARLKNIPVWAFHGEDDDTVYVEESIKMVEMINRRGGNAKLTVYKNTAHNSWSATYQNADVFKWLFANVKNNDETTRTDFNDSEIYG